MIDSREDRIEPVPDEETSLLPKKQNDGDQSDSQEEGELLDFLPEDETPTRKLVLHEFWVLLKGSIPVILAYTLQNSLQTISILIVGRESPKDLSTAAFSYMFAMCSAWLIGMGGSTALDTLASSTFTGSKNKHDLGILLQRSFIILGLFYIPVVVVWIFSEHLFRALGQDEQLSRDSAKFLTCLIPGGLGYVSDSHPKDKSMPKKTLLIDILTRTDLFRDNEEIPPEHGQLQLWYLCSTHHVTHQCWTQLSVCLCGRLGTLLSPLCHRKW
jgi:MATE family multidrug resistance protein